MPLKIKIKNKTSLRLLWPAVTIGLVFVFVLFFYFNSTKNSSAAIKKYYTIEAGDWKDQIWSGVSNSGAKCNCAPSNSINSPLSIRHSVTFDGSMLQINGSAIDIIGNGNLFANGNFQLSNRSVINVGEGDTLFIHGNVELSGISSINVSGYFVIDGNITLTDNSIVNGTGNGIVTGTKTGSGWGLGAILPFEIKTIEAKKTSEHSAVIDWKTSSENNNFYYLIERSSDGINFETVDIISGAGTSTFQNAYTWKDEHPLSDVNYYRLKPNGFCARFFSSPVQTIQFSKQAPSNTAYPNPINKERVLHINTPSSSTAKRFLLLNSAGVIVHEETINIQNDNETISINLSDKALPPGLYVYSLYNGDNQTLSKGKLVIR